MHKIDQLIEQRAVDELVPLLDGRRGSVLFVGAHLPQVAAHVLKRGVFVTVAESNADLIDAFVAPLKAEGLDVAVTVDRRPYQSVEFLSSSYNAVIAWAGAPPDMPIELFFKKTRRELKAGGTLFMRVPVKPATDKLFPAASRFVERLPGQVKKLADKASGGLKVFFSPEALDPDAVLAAASRHYNLDKTTPLAVLGERLLHSRLGAALDALPDKAVSFLFRADTSLCSGSASHFATSVLFHFAKTKEFGKVFRVP